MVRILSRIQHEPGTNPYSNLIRGHSRTDRISCLTRSLPPKFIRPQELWIFWACLPSLRWRTSASWGSERVKPMIFNTWGLSILAILLTLLRIPTSHCVTLCLLVQDSHKAQCYSCNPVNEWDSSGASLLTTVAFISIFYYKSDIWILVL